MRDICERRKTDEILLPLAITCFAKLPRIKNPTRIFKVEGKRRTAQFALAYRLSLGKYEVKKW